MAPTSPDFRTNFYLDFSSNYVAEKVVFKAFKDRVQEVSEFATAETIGDSGCTSVRGKMHEKLCHKWFELAKQRTLQLRSLCSQTDREITLKEMQTIRFSNLNDITAPQQNTYYWPTLQIFGALLDAFFVIGNDCFGLKMTRNQNQRIQAALLSSFLTWLKSVGIAQDHFYFVSWFQATGLDLSRSKSFERRLIVSRRLRNSVNVKQYVVALDVFMKDPS